MKKNVFKNPDNAYRPKRRPKLFALGSTLRFSFLTENLGFIGYLSFLGIIYIANSHYAVKTIREINKLQEETKKSVWESNARKSELMFNSMQSEVAKRAAPIGLRELVERPKKIIIEKE